MRSIICPKVRGRMNPSALSEKLRVSRSRITATLCLEEEGFRHTGGPRMTEAHLLPDTGRSRVPKAQAESGGVLTGWLRSGEANVLTS